MDCKPSWKGLESSPFSADKKVIWELKDTEVIVHLSDGDIKKVGATPALVFTSSSIKLFRSVAKKSFHD